MLFLVVAAGIYCINPSNVEFFVNTWFYRELVNLDHVRQKIGLPLQLGEVEIRKQKEKSFETISLLTLSTSENV